MWLAIMIVWSQAGGAALQDPQGATETKEACERRLVIGQALAQQQPGMIIVRAACVQVSEPTVDAERAGRVG